MEVLMKNNVPLDKIIGICSDGASTMQSIYKGVCTQLARFIRNMRETTIAEIMAHDDNGRCAGSFHEA